MTLPDKFLEEIAKEIGLFPDRKLKELKYWTFVYRFKPDFYSLMVKEIAQKVTITTCRDAVDGIGMTLKGVIEIIYGTFEEELIQDGYSKEQLFPNGNGQPKISPWKVVYEWLWEYKYPRWKEDYIWNSWKEEATQHQHSRWIEFILDENITKGMVVPQPPMEENLKVGVSYSVNIDLNNSGACFLLFNRGLSNEGVITRYLVMPSSAFAPNPILKEINFLPQEDAMCKSIEFDAEGKEEYIGILIDKNINLSELRLNTEDPILEWNREHLEKVWQQLENSDTRKIFYRDFEVGSGD